MILRARPLLTALPVGTVMLHTMVNTALQRDSLHQLVVQLEGALVVGPGDAALAADRRLIHPEIVLRRLRGAHDGTSSKGTPVQRPLASHSCLPQGATVSPSSRNRSRTSTTSWPSKSR